MPGVDLDTVETRLPGAPRGGCELIDDQGDVVLFQHLDLRRLVAGEPGHLFHQEIIGETALGRRRDRWCPERQVPRLRRVVRYQPAVMQLRRDFGVVRMHPVGQLPQTRHETIFRDRRLLPGNAADRPGHPAYTADDKARAALGLRLVVGDQLFPDGTVFFRKTHAHGGDGDAVF